MLSARPRCADRVATGMLADLRRLEARMLLDRGGGDDHLLAAQLLQEALTAYRIFGMPVYAAETERLIGQAEG